MKTVPLKRLASTTAGGTPSIDDDALWGEGQIPWVTISDMSTNAIVDATARSITEAGRRAARLSIGRPGTTLFAMYASVGAVAQLGISATWNQAILGILPRDDMADSRFLNYSLRMLSPQLEALTRSNTQSNLNADQVANLPIPAHTLKQQRVIADFLDAEIARIDGIMDRRRQQADLLEARFVQLVRERTFEEGGCRRLSRFVSSVKTGSTPADLEASLSESDDSLEWISPVDIGVLLELRHAKRRISRMVLVQKALPLFAPDGVLIVGIGATAARVAYVDRLVSGNQQITSIAPRRELSARFLAWQLYGRQEELRSLAPYTTLPIINNDFLRSLPVWVPELAVQQAIAADIDESGTRTYEITGLLSAQVALLQERKQALITAAVTGQLDLAREIAEEAS